MNKVIESLTEFVFLEHAPQAADVIFIAGGARVALGEKAAELWQAGYAPLIVPSGRWSIRVGYFTGPDEQQETYAGPYETEAEFLAAVMRHNGVPSEAILLEDQATYTKQNAEFTQALLAEKGITPKRAILVCKPRHARRAWMYYQLAFPQVALLVCPCRDEGNNRHNWYKSEEGIKQVMGTITRVGEQITPQLIALLDEPEE